MHIYKTYIYIYILYENIYVCIENKTFSFFPVIFRFLPNRRRPNKITKIVKIINLKTY